MTVRRRKKVKMMIPLASMGDIAFLLIIFFMLVSTFMKDNMEYDPATGADLRELQSPEISVVVDQDGKLWLQGLEAGVGQLADAVENLVGQRRHDTPVHLSVHKDLKRPDYMPVIEALSEAGVRVLMVGLQESDS